MVTMKLLLLLFVLVPITLGEETLRKDEIPLMLNRLMKDVTEKFTKKFTELGAEIMNIKEGYQVRFLSSIFLISK